MAKRKAEADFFSLQEEIEQLETDAKNADERAAKSASEVRLLNGCGFHILELHCICLV